MPLPGKRRRFREGKAVPAARAAQIFRGSVPPSRMGRSAQIRVRTGKRALRLCEKTCPEAWRQYLRKTAASGYDSRAFCALLCRLPVSSRMPHRKTTEASASAMQKGLLELVVTAAAKRGSRHPEDVSGQMAAPEGSAQWKRIAAGQRMGKGVSARAALADAR